MAVAFTHEQFLAERLSGIGASDAGIIMGVGLRTPYDLWREKTGRRPSADLQGIPRVYWGTKLEDLVAAEFAQRHPTWNVRRRRYAVRSKRPEWQFALAHLDRTVRDDTALVPLEIKTSQDFDEWESGIPHYYVGQVQHQLAVTGAPYAYVAALLSGYDYRERIVPRDDAYTLRLWNARRSSGSSCRPTRSRP
ncbi:MAG: YqaJ viral recombinase family protein [Candidatus Baltobacteraceae bacterium]